MFKPLNDLRTRGINIYPMTEFRNELLIDEQIAELFAYVTNMSKLTNEMVEYLNNFIETFDSKLHKTVYDILNQWLKDGVLTEIISDVFEEFLSKAKKSIHGQRIISLTEYPRLATEISDEYRIQRMIDDANDYDILEFTNAEKLYMNKTTITINKPLTLLGYHCEWITECDCTTYTLKIIDTHDVTIDGIFINQNLKGRNSFWFENCHDIVIRNCGATGYTAEFGHYQTDSALMLYNCFNVLVDNFHCYEHGFQYGTATETLNRSITFQGIGGYCVIQNCKMEKVNQGIVIDTGTVMVKDCYFENTRDNDIYIVGGEYVLVDGCYMNDYYDESIVVGTVKEVVVSNCNMNNIPNKAFAITNNISSLTIENVKVHNEIETGQFIMWRDSSYTVDSLRVKRCTFSNTQITNSYRYFDIYNVKSLAIEDLKLDLKTISDAHNIWQMENVYGTINNVDSKANNINGQLFVTRGSSLIEVKNISNNGTRIAKDRMKVDRQLVQVSTSTPYVLRNAPQSIIYTDGVPQSQNADGTRWVIGDIAINMDTVNTRIASWYWTGSEWEPFSYKKNRPLDRAGTPINWLLPRYVGDIAVDTENNAFYISIGLTTNDWKKIVTE